MLKTSYCELVERNTADLAAVGINPPKNDPHTTMLRVCGPLHVQEVISARLKANAGRISPGT